MKRLGGPSILIPLLFGMLLFPAHSANAQSQPEYTVIDLGTFGGAQSITPVQSVILNNQGMVTGQADTASRDPYQPNDNPFFGANAYGPPDPFIEHAFVYRDGRLTDLGAVPGPNSSGTSWINNQGDAAGNSDNGVMDPLTGYAASVATLWTHGKLINLGTLGGYESNAGAVNDQDQVAGMSSNTVNDPYSMLGWGTQTRGFLWQNGKMQDIGTLGGPDTFVAAMNQSGQITGWSYTNNIANAATQQPTQDPYLWTNGSMQDLGTLGGTVGFAFDVNDRGDVVGTSNLAGDQTHHAFHWSKGKLIDLGTFGGNNSEGFWENSAGDATGRADVPGSKSHHAFLWKNGVMTDLGTIPGRPNSTGYSVNSRDQVVGDANEHGWIWENGSMRSLDDLVAPTSIHIGACKFINDRGEITCSGLMPGGGEHAVLLEPIHRTTASQGSTIPMATTGSTSSFTVWFDSASPGQGEVLFGSGPGCSGLVETATRDSGSSPTTHSVTVTGNDLPGTVGDNGIVPGATYWYETVTVTATGQQIDDNGGQCYSVTVPTS